MHVLKSLSARLKGQLLGDLLLRRHPLFYPAALELFERLEGATLEQRKQFTMQRVRKVLYTASRTRYGRQMTGTDRITDWPLLEKPAVRAGGTATGGQRGRHDVV